MGIGTSLRSVSHPDVFAPEKRLMESAALPKSGAYAAGQGAVLAKNRKCVLRGMPMLDFAPQRQPVADQLRRGRHREPRRLVGGRRGPGGGGLIDRRWIAKSASLARDQDLPAFHGELV